jgi:hypothetical protein
MITYPPNLINSFLTICEIITFKVDGKVVLSMPKGGNKVLEAKKTILLGIWNEPL